MPGQPHDPGLDLASRPAQPGLTAADLVAIGLALLWLVGAGSYLLLGGALARPETLGSVVAMLALVLPVAIIWVAASAARSARHVREESERLQAAFDAIRHAYIEDRQSRGAAPPARAWAAPTAPAAPPAEALPEPPLTFSSRRARAGAAEAEAEEADGQPRLALGPPAEEAGPPLPLGDFVRALNFPDNEEDEAGFSALRRALKDRRARQLIQASQDVLTLLSQEGIYMDDLRPDRARPELWRRFTAGERGGEVASLGGIRDRECLALTIGRMREDTIFRDAAHHFMRLFDRILGEIEPELTDEELAALTQTRTARAFMLLGRVAGAFD
ncbi:hypothetical protein [Pseudoroseicyclus tamaricis]|uniref:Uncharacterized protein n=1 Tax=Pseudoroseicyclus tamaricis TaxID=2705421 RepID=A0A6B2JEX4_9RHOB|nr:hypothetical protein [Pseudoroseicyclus tamaricis]NDU99482.1 hypothetical protein [Pseudoroseicyclus tamaricis]